MRTRLSHSKRKGVALMIIAVALMFIMIPSIGLAVDGAVVYMLRAKLQSATDAAAVAAARSFSNGLNPSAQTGSATATAIKYFRSNMNSAWTPLTAPDPVVTFPTSSQPRTITINVVSTAIAPTYFMKVLKFNSVTITALSQAVRREVKIIMVLDRSGSLANSNSCDDLRESAKGFVNSFVDGRDQIGMVSFGTSYRVDFPIATNFKSTTGTTLPTMLGNLNCVGGTNSGAAYWTAYQQLTLTPEPGVLNVILFFTDGQPNTVHAPTLQILTGAGGSTCSSTATRNGVIAPATNGTSVLGIYRPTPSGAPPVTSDQVFISSNSGCYFSANGGNSASQVYRDVNGLSPTGAANEVDAVGNSFNGWKTLSRNAAGRIRIDHNPTITNAGINTLDNAARRARDDAFARGLELMTFAIGLGGPGAAEDELMNRVANTASSTALQNDRPKGLYIRADNVTQLDEAFAQLASETMRFAK